MASHKLVWQMTRTVVVGLLICCAAVIGIYALLGQYSSAVLRGALMGTVLAALNFFAMALGADMMADRSQEQEISKGQMMIQLSYLGRMILLFVILAICAKTGWFDLIALVLPLLFVRPILTVSELIKKKKGGDANGHEH